MGAQPRGICHPYRMTDNVFVLRSEIMTSNVTTPLTEMWFASGERLGYDPQNRTIDPAAAQKVFIRVDGDVKHAVTFLPGYPDGSIGWARLLPYLPDAATMPKLFVEYLGMGDSDKPRDYAYSTAERTDLVEAIWRHFGVISTTLAAFDFGSLVVLEHLARRLEQRSTGPSIRGVFIFNGGLFTDGHSHPWFTTPVLRRMPVDLIPQLAKPPFDTFKRAARVMWSKHYRAWENDARDLYSAMSRHDGLFFLYRAAGFVSDHRAQGSRLDFGRIYDAYRAEIPFLVGGSDEDPFEHRQVTLTQERLGAQGPTIAHLPGGHLTTNEQPQALARLIEGFYDATARNKLPT
jgi:pimeloyl-ACP methyl ester carboxylesterase